VAASRMPRSSAAWSRAISEGLIPAVGLAPAQRLLPKGHRHTQANRSKSEMGLSVPSHETHQSFLTRSSAAGRFGPWGHGHDSLVSANRVEKLLRVILGKLSRNLRPSGPFSDSSPRTRSSGCCSALAVVGLGWPGPAAPVRGFCFPGWPFSFCCLPTLRLLLVLFALLILGLLVLLTLFAPPGSCLFCWSRLCLLVGFCSSLLLMLLLFKSRQLRFTRSRL